MPKAYWIAHIQVNDPDRYRTYAAEAFRIVGEFGGRYLARAGQTDPVEAADLPPRHVIVEFESMEKARACYNSPAYQKARAIRQAASTGNLLILEGAD